MRSRILVTGSNGQLGCSIRKIAGTCSEKEFVFATKDILDITNVESISNVFKKGNFDFCINAAAYTNVEQAEKEPKQAYEINAEGTKNIANACKNHHVVLIHISTDYVFDGEKRTPYAIDDMVKPINEYGKSKLEGEKYCQEIMKRYYIIRTSWLYSEFGHNFYKTVLKKAQTEEVLYITNEQMGCPTNANNLARYILDTLINHTPEHGIYHFTDGKAMTWYDFAKEIIGKNKLKSKIKISNYTTLAKRPKYSVLKIDDQKTNRD